MHSLRSLVKKTVVAESVIFLMFPDLRVETRSINADSEWPKTYSEVFAIYGNDHFGKGNFIFTH